MGLLNFGGLPFNEKSASRRLSEQMNFGKAG